MDFCRLFLLFCPRWRAALGRNSRFYWLRWTSSYRRWKLFCCKTVISDGDREPLAETADYFSFDNFRLSSWLRRKAFYSNIQRSKHLFISLTSIVSKSDICIKSLHWWPVHIELQNYRTTEHWSHEWRVYCIIANASHEKNTNTDISANSNDTQTTIQCRRLGLTISSDKLFSK